MAIEIKKNELLKNYSIFKIGGPADYFVSVKDKEEFLEAVNFARDKKIPYFIIGGASNILFGDEGYRGLIIQSQFSGISYKDSVITVGSGVLLSQLLNFCIQNDLSGLEWAIGIPGTVGGAIVDNSGAYGHSISENVISVFAIDADGNIKRYDKDDCLFTYRESRFKKQKISEGKMDFILEAGFQFLKKGRAEIMEEIQKNLLQRKDRIPAHPSVGCIFKNPKPQSAGRLIEMCGLKGKRIGDVMISNEHANIMINLGDGTAKDVLELIQLCKEAVKKNFNIELEEEVIKVL